MQMQRDKCTSILCTYASTHRCTNMRKSERKTGSNIVISVWTQKVNTLVFTVFVDSKHPHWLKNTQRKSAVLRSPTVGIWILLHSFGTWPPSPYGHRSPVGHSFGLCHPSIVLDPPSAIAITSSNPYGCSLASASIEDWFGTLCQDLSSPLGMIKSWSKIGHMTNPHCWFFVNLKRR